MATTHDMVDVGLYRVSDNGGVYPQVTPQIN